MKAVVLRIRSGFGSDTDPTSQLRTDRIRIVFRKIYLTNFILIKFVMPHSFLFSQINKFIYIVINKKINYFAKELAEMDCFFSFICK
jgi:hypothetical protein